MQYRDLRDFISGLEKRGELKRIQVPVSPKLEMTEICDRTLRAKGPALLFENPVGYDIPVLGNLFGTPERVALATWETPQVQVPSRWCLGAGCASSRPRMSIAR